MKPKELLKKLKGIIEDKELLEAGRVRENAFSRNRKMSFSQALCFMLDMGKTTVQTRLNEYFHEIKGGEPISQQAFSKLRKNFDHSPFETMVRSLVKEEYRGTYALSLWEGYHLLSVDGSKLQLPRVDELREEFGTSGRGDCPSAGISVLYDIMHGWVLDASMPGKELNEREECKKHIKFLCEELPKIAEKSLILLDRGYPGLDLLKTLQESGVKFVVRGYPSLFNEIDDAPMGSSVVTLKDGVCVRVVKLELSTGETEILVSNEFDIETELFGELYALRWGIETAYFRLKRELCVEKFSGKTPNSIRQDFWASMVLLNAACVFQHEADKAIDKRQQGKSLKHEYQARTSDLIVTMRNNFIFATLTSNASCAQREMNRIIRTMARSTSAIRDDRSFPRSPKPYFRVNHNLKSTL